MRGKVFVTALAAVFFVSAPAFAGWRLTWQPSGAISLKLVKVPKGGQEVDMLVGIVNPTTGEGRSGNLELRLSGVVVKQFVKPPYYFEFPVDQPIFPDQDLQGRIEGQENVAQIMLNDGLDHVFEAWFTVRDHKGRIVRGKQASPTVSFRLDPLAVDPAAAASAIEQRFNETIEALKKQVAQQKKEYDEAVAKLEAEKKAQQERYEAASHAASAAVPTRKVVLIVDSKEAAGPDVSCSTAENEVWLELKGADRYLVFAEGKQRSFNQETPLSIRINKGYSGQLRLIAFIGDRVTEYQITAKGAG